MAGVQREYSSMSEAPGSWFRCDADPKNLDDPNASPRTQDRTAVLLESEDPDSLWYNHGIVADFQVHFHGVCTSTPFSWTCLQPFTMWFPHADIHELLTSDLLHQAIKGAFKDHLVVWVEEYLKRTHGPSKSASILDEID